MTIWFHVRELLTAKDKRRAAPVIRKWLRGFFDEDVDWGEFFAKYEDVFSKTRPPKPVVIYRCPRSSSENGEYDRWTSWSYDTYISFGRGDCWKERVQATVHPDDIEVVLAAFGEKIYSEGMSEVILRPGRYIIAPARSFDDFRNPPPLSPANWASDEAR